MTRARDLANSADLSFDGSTFKIDTANNRVGIGTTSPATQLHIDEVASNSYATLRLEGSNRGGDIEMYQGTVPVSTIRTDQSGNMFFKTSGAYGNSSVDNRLTILTAGNVGVGTDNPSTKLHVDGGGSQPELRVAQNSTYYTDIGVNHIDVNGPNDLRFLMGGADKVRFKSDGKVGIGTNTPTKLLHLYGDENVGGLGIVIQDDGWGAPNGMFMTTVRNSDGAYTIRKNTSNAMDFATYTDMLSVKGNGNVMIGTTTAGLANNGDQLTVSDSGNTGITIRSTNSGQNNIYFSDGTTGSEQYIGYITYQHDVNALRFGANDNEAMRILSTGTILAHKTSSDGALTGFEARTSGQVMATVASATNEAVMYITQTGGGGNNGDDQGLVVKTQGTNAVSGTGNVLRIAANNSTHGTFDNILVAKNNGNVGIGTDSPVYELDVRGVFISPIGITSTHTGAHPNQYPITNRTIINGRLNLSFNVYFQHNTSNLAVRLYCPVASWWASGEVIIGSTYSYGNASGFRRYTFTHNYNSSVNYNHTLTNTENRGSTSSHLELHSHGWDATEGAHYWEFRHIASSGNYLYCQFQTFGSGTTVETVNWYYRHVTY